MKTQHIYSTDSLPDDKRLTLRTITVIIGCLVAAPCIVVAIAYAVPDGMVRTVLLWLGILCYVFFTVWFLLEQIKQFLKELKDSRS